MNRSDLERAAAVLRKAKRVVVMTGAGVSAESGVPTFRAADGLWEGHRIEEVATPEGFFADPEKVWRFYDGRRQNLARVSPNPGHEVMARWQERFAAYTLVTQNVDGLHQRAGSRGVLELHGSIWRVRCAECHREREDRTVPLAELPPRCALCGGLERPGVVWFGEILPQDTLDAAARAAVKADAALVAGTSSLVYPAAGLVELAAGSGATVIEVNPVASALAQLAEVALRGPSGEVLPVLEELLESAP